MMKKRLDSHPLRAGFTLIELLAVIVIIGILATVLVSQFGSVEAAAEVETTRQDMTKLEAVLENYATDHGGYPPSHFTSEQGVVNDGTNIGAEALVVAFWSKGYEAGGLLQDMESKLVNTDGDSSSKRLTDFETRSLLEMPDAWGNPIAYIHKDDYQITNRQYVLMNPRTGEEVLSTPQAYKDGTTGRFFNKLSYQLISAGLDGEFGTEDDITTFDRD